MWYNSPCRDEQNTGALCFPKAAGSAQLDIARKAPSASRIRPGCSSRQWQQANGGRSAMSERSQTYKKWWGQLVEMYGHHCYYCREEIATTIDHIVPYSWDGDNQLDNLVPACMLCNCIASNKMFDTLEQKRQYIMAQRKGRTSQRAICTDCLLPYTYLTHSCAPNAMT